MTNLFSTMASTEPLDATRETSRVWLLDLQGTIGPASSDLFTRSLIDAQKKKVDLFLLRLDTPGGLDMAMRDMIQGILASSVPVVVYVWPKGARAASAGTYILYSAHFAAMAPATNLGAATPIRIGDSNSPPPQNTPKEANGKSPLAEEKGAALEKKQINDSTAYIRGLAELRNRNVEWAESAVRSAASLSANEALKYNVIDLIAEDTEDLLKKLNGRTVTFNQRSIRMNLNVYKLHQVDHDWRHRFLAVITDPNVAYLLIMIGVYGIILEFYNPGMGAPGIIGAICLITGMYALQMLPISYAGLALLFLGVMLLVVEAFTPSFGVLGSGGLISFMFGSIMLMDTELPAFQIALPLILALTVVSALVLFLVLHLILKSRRKKVVSGIETMIGQTAIAIEDFEAHGFVRAQGEAWHAKSKGPVHKGDVLIIQEIEGLTLYVESQS